MFIDDPDIKRLDSFYASFHVENSNIPKGYELYSYDSGFVKFVNSDSGWYIIYNKNNEPNERFRVGYEPDGYNNEGRGADVSSAMLDRAQNLFK
jgi:hypothetical protein